MSGEIAIQAIIRQADELYARTATDRKRPRQHRNSGKLQQETNTRFCGDWAGRCFFSVRRRRIETPLSQIIAQGVVACEQAVAIGPARVEGHFWLARKSGAAPRNCADECLPLGMPDAQSGSYVRQSKLIRRITAPDRCECSPGCNINFHACWVAVPVAHALTTKQPSISRRRIP